ncbi:hypothetical protein PUN28_018867 [Cardiocondyla obscurior]|uniref:Uncharacterized protein n=1 Tax=Cardiocondyla obscurior TaxID=286306 RepID=A0AAW2ECE9_9HYME
MIEIKNRDERIFIVLIYIRDIRGDAYFHRQRTTRAATRNVPRVHFMFLEFLNTHLREPGRESWPRRRRRASSFFDPRRAEWTRPKTWYRAATSRPVLFAARHQVFGRVRSVDENQKVTSPAFFVAAKALTQVRASDRQHLQTCVERTSSHATGDPLSLLFATTVPSLFTFREVSLNEFQRIDNVDEDVSTRRISSFLARARNENVATINCPTNCEFCLKEFHSLNFPSTNKSRIRVYSKIKNIRKKKRNQVFNIPQSPSLKLAKKNKKIK